MHRTSYDKHNIKKAIKIGRNEIYAPLHICASKNHIVSLNRSVKVLTGILGRIGIGDQLLIKHTEEEQNFHFDQQANFDWKNIR